MDKIGRRTGAKKCLMAHAVTLAIVAVHPQTRAASAEACGPTSSLSGQTFAVTGSEVFLRSAPNAKGAKLINEKATKILKSTEYLSIDSTVTVEEECKQSGWSRVHVIDPESLRQSHVGWVQSNSLRKSAAQTAAPHISERRAIELCESYARASTNHPSTFSFSRVWGFGLKELPDGGTLIVSTFTAKNGFGAEQKFDIRCLLDSSGLIHADISEANN